MSVPSPKTPRNVSSPLSHRPSEVGRRLATGVSSPLGEPGTLESPFDMVLNHEHPWSSRDIGTNSISGIMNDVEPPDKSLFAAAPKLILRTAAVAVAETNPIVPPAVIRKVKISEHDSFLRNLADVIDKYQLNRALGWVATEGIPQLGEGVDSLDANVNELLEEYSTKIMGSHAHNSKLSRFQRTRMLSASAPALDTIPSLFLDEKFDLSNPHTFSAVYDYLDITGVNTNDVATVNRELQDKLTNYLDTVEVHLLKEISRRSTSFFSALSQLQDLHNETEACVKKIADLRARLSNVANKTATKGLNVVRMKRRRGNLGLLYGAVKLVSELKQSQPMIQILLGQADYVGCLELIETTMLLLKGIDPFTTRAESSAYPSSTTKKISNSNLTTSDAVIEERLADGIRYIRNRSILPKNLDLRGVRSVVHLNGQLVEMSRTISLVMENEFVNILISDLKENVILMSNGLLGKPMGTPSSASLLTFNKQQSLPMNSFIQNILTSQSSFVPSTPTVPMEIPHEFLSQEEKLRTRLTPLILGLIRMDKFGSAIQSFKSALMKQVKEISRKLYPDVKTSSSEVSKADAKKEAQAALMKQLRNMTFDAFYKLLLDVFVCMLHILQRAAIQRDLIISIIKTAQTQGIVIGMECLRSAGKLDHQQSVANGVGSRRGTMSGGKRSLYDDDDDFGSFVELNDFADPLSRSRSRPDILADAASPLSTAGILGSEMGLDGAASTFQQMISDASEPLFGAADLSHIRCSKLIVVRSDQNSQLNQKDFDRLFKSTWEFVIAGESLCGRICLGLKGSIMSQAKNYMTHFHDERSKQVAALVETEQWSQADVPVEFQSVVDALVKLAQSQNDGANTSNVADAFDDDVHTPAADDEEDLDLGTTQSTPTVEKNLSRDAPDNAVPKMQKVLAVQGVRFYAVGAVLVFLKALSDYVHSAQSIPALSTDIMNKIFEILKLFNSRVCQVILGAGALQSAGLKNITARHIALASQSLSIVIATIPHLKIILANLLTTKQQALVSDLDKIQRDYTDHQKELHMKLVNIMNDRLIAHASKLTAISWDSPDMKEFPQPEGVSTHMLTLVKETVTLHKVLAKYFPSESLKMIMTEIFKNFNKLLEEYLRKIDFFTSAGKNRLMIDIQYFIRELSALEGVDGPGSHLEICVNNMKIRDKRALGNPSSGLQSTGHSQTNLTGGNAPESNTLNRTATFSGTKTGTSTTTPAAGLNTKFSFGNMLRSNNNGNTSHGSN